MHDLRERKDPQTDSKKLTNTNADAAPDGNLWRIGEDHSARDRGYREPDPNHGPDLANGSIAYNRIEGQWRNELSARTRVTTPIEVDGAMGEGGGQVLRSALSLSLLTGQCFRLSRIRSNRDRPGLRPQHLAAVRAAARVASAEVRGDRVGSEEIAFAPGPVRPGDYFFDIGTAGATSLVLQTLLLPLARAPGTSSITIRGGTHVPWSPCFHYLDWQWRPFLNQSVSPSI